MIRKSDVKVLTILCLGIFAVLLLYVILNHHSEPQLGQQSKIQPATLAPPEPKYEERFCDETNEVDYSNRNVRTFSIKLHEGCFDGPYKTPISWQTAQFQNTRNPEDWIAVWCDGTTKPKPIVRAPSDLESTFQGCGDATKKVFEFSLQGHGTLSIRKLTAKPEFQNLPEETVQSNDSESSNIAALPPPPTKEQPSEPILPENPIDGYTITMNRCHRSGMVDIECRGMLRNDTDIVKETRLYYGNAVDDAGGTFHISGIRFENGNDTAKVMPHLAYQYVFSITDENLAAKTISMQLTMILYTGRGFISGHSQYSEDVRFTNIHIVK